MVARLWLGKYRALETPPPLLEEFCHFYGGFNSERIIINHLNEFGRDERDLWEEEHCQIVREHMALLYPAVEIEGKNTGQTLNLSKKD